jgi:toxin ParE1/3/4
MPSIIKRPAAETDLDEIWWHIAQDNPINADRFLDRIQDSCQTLADYPHMGVKRDELKPGLRSHPVDNYLIYYFPLADGIEILRVLHGSRDAGNFTH